MAKGLLRLIYRLSPACSRVVSRVPRSVRWVVVYLLLTGLLWVIWEWQIPERKPENRLLFAAAGAGVVLGFSMALVRWIDRER